MKELRFGKTVKVSYPRPLGQDSNPDSLPSSSLTNILETVLVTAQQAFSIMTMHYNNNNISTLVRITVKERSTSIIHALAQGGMFPPNLRRIGTSCT